VASAEPLLDRLRRFSARISIRLLAFNILLVFLPAAGILYFDTYEEQLLAAQERTMVQQGRVLAAALSQQVRAGREAESPLGQSPLMQSSLAPAGQGGDGGGELDAAAAGAVLSALDQRLPSRLRILDRNGLLLADTSLLGPRREPAGEGGDDADDGGYGEGEEDRRANWLYRLGAWLYRSYDRLRGRGDGSGAGVDFYASDRPFAGPEVRAALDGRYGAATRLTPGQRSVTLYSAIPVRAGEGGGGEVLGVVLVSQSTLRLLRDLYDVRLAVFQVFLVSVGVAVVLSLVVGGTIVRPIRRLRREAAEILDRRGRLQGHFGGSRRHDEIGDLARALEELSRRLAEHQGFLESFAADVSHEFKNPLAGIRTASDMLREAADAEEIRRYTAMIQGEVSRLETLLSAVREITRLDARLDDDEREEVELGDLLANIIEAFSRRGRGGKAREAAIELALPPEPVRVLASPDRLVRAVENLLANALSFAPEGTAVEVGVERREGEIVLTVADRGPGIPEENLPRLFDRFFTYRPGSPAPGEPHPRRSHSGLGLAIVKTIVEGQGGRVRAENREGGGALFECTLPPSHA